MCVCVCMCAPCVCLYVYVCVVCVLCVCVCVCVCVHVCVCTMYECVPYYKALNVMGVSLHDKCFDNDCFGQSTKFEFCTLIKYVL